MSKRGRGKSNQRPSYPDVFQDESDEVRKLAVYAYRDGMSICIKTRIARRSIFLTPSAVRELIRTLQHLVVGMEE